MSDLDKYLEDRKLKDKEFSEDYDKGHREFLEKMKEVRDMVELLNLK